MLERISGVIAAGAEWLRAGYPTGVPRTGHSTLLALCGPLSLTQDQKDCITAELDSEPADITTIEVMITKTTGRLPTPPQTREILRLLHQRTARD